MTMEALHTGFWTQNLLRHARVAVFLAASLTGCSECFLSATEMEIIDRRRSGAETRVLGIDSPRERLLLQTKSRAIDPRAAGITRLIDEMKRTADANRADGIAAVQIAVPVRVLLLKCAAQDHTRDFEAFVNPGIVDASPDRIGSWEHCLSVPWGYRYTERPSAVTVRYRDPAGALRTTVLRNDEAVVLQQELDHLDGVLLSDGLSSDWFVPSDRIDAFAGMIRAECANTSRSLCNEMMKKKWMARARNSEPGIPK